MHVASHSKKSKGGRVDFMCYRCGKKAETLYNLKVHEKLHDNDLVQCYFCPWRTVSEEGRKISIHLDKHFRGSQNRNFPCSFCDKAFAFPETRRRHEETFHDKLTSRYKCKMCSFVSHDYMIVYRHQKNKH